MLTWNPKVQVKDANNAVGLPLSSNPKEARPPILLNMLNVLHQILKAK